MEAEKKIKSSGQKKLPAGRSLWMLDGRTLLFPILMSHGNADESGNFSCRKLPVVFWPVFPIELKTKSRKRWNRNRRRGSSSLVVSSKMSCDNVGARATKNRIAQRRRCILEEPGYGTDTRLVVFLLLVSLSHTGINLIPLKIGFNKKCTAQFITISLQRIA